MDFNKKTRLECWGETIEENAPAYKVLAVYVLSERLEKNV